MNEIQTFKNPLLGNLRTVAINGKEYFFGVDVATALQYKRPRKAVKDNCKGVLTQDTLINEGGYPELLISEGDMYRLIVKATTQSTSEDVRTVAEKFETWVFDEVLPQLRKTGSYGLKLTTEEQIRLIAQGNVELNRKVEVVEKKTESLEERFDKFEKDLPLLPEEADSVSGAVKKRVVDILGGKKSNAYHDKSISQTAFIDAYRNLKRNFNVRSYKCIKRHQIDQALRIAMEYEPPMFLENLIEQSNAQMSLDTLTN